MQEKNPKHNKIDLYEVTKNLKISEKDKKKYEGLYKDRFSRNEKQNELNSKYDEMYKSSNQKTKYTKSNIVILKRFIKQYNENLSKLVNGNNIKKTPLFFNFESLNNLIKILHFLSPKEIQNKEGSITESSLSLIEKKLVNDIFKNLKNADNLVSSEHLFMFLLVVLNVKEIHEEINKVHTEKIELYSPKETMTDNTELKEEEMKSDTKLEVKSITSTKFGLFDKNNSLTISNEIARNIFKDYYLFYLNWSNHFYNLKKEKKRFKSAQFTFSPKINKNSDTLSRNYRDIVKIKTNNLSSVEHLRTFSGNQNDEYTKQKHYVIEYSDNNIKSIENFLIKKKKKEQLYEKNREIKEMIEIKECSFKPNINHFYPSPSRVDRFKQLYQIGSQSILMKRDKTQEQLEYEKYGDECTFKPILTKETVKFENINKFSDSEEKFIQRMEIGRLEKDIRDNLDKRGALSTKELAKVNKMRKSNDKIKLISYKNQNIPLNNNTKSFKSQLKEFKIPLNINDNKVNSENKSLDEPIVRENEFPLLIIDVNIRPGVKKKIYVYEGDTPLKLTENFSKKHNLDLNTQTKLKSLVQSHMSRLLMKIEEEKNSERSYQK